jgi:hypothetical protein
MDLRIATVFMHFHVAFGVVITLGKARVGAMPSAGPPNTMLPIATSRSAAQPTPPHRRRARCICSCNDANVTHDPMADGLSAAGLGRWAAFCRAADQTESSSKNLHSESKLPPNLLLITSAGHKLRQTRPVRPKLLGVQPPLSRVVYIKAGSPA